MWKLLGAFSLICPSCARSLTNAAAATAAFVVGGRVSSRRSVILTRLPTVKLNQLSFSLLQCRIRIHSAYRLLCVYVLTWFFFWFGIFFLRFGVFLLLLSLLTLCVCVHFFSELGIFLCTLISFILFWQIVVLFLYWEMYLFKIVARAHALGRVQNFWMMFKGGLDWFCSEGECRIVVCKLWAYHR